MARLTDLESGNESPSGRSDSDFTGPDPDEVAQVSQRCCTGILTENPPCSDSTDADPDDVAQFSQRCCTGAPTQAPMGSGFMARTLMTLHRSTSQCSRTAICVMPAIMGLNEDILASWQHNYCCTCLYLSAAASCLGCSGQLGSETVVPCSSMLHLSQPAIWCGVRLCCVVSASSLLQSKTLSTWHRQGQRQGPGAGSGSIGAGTRTIAGCTFRGDAALWDDRSSVQCQP